MLDVFKDVFMIITSMISDIVGGLNYSMVDKFDLDLKLVDIRLILFSDTPMISTNLFDIIVYVLLVLLVIFLWKLISSILKIPFRLLKGGL